MRIYKDKRIEKKSVNFFFVKISKLGDISKNN